MGITRSLSFTMLMREELRQKMHELGDIFFLHSSIIHPYPVFWKTMFPSLFLWMVMVLNISVCTVLSSQRPTACLMINVNPTTVKIYSIILYLHACEGVAFNYHRNVPHFRTFCRHDMEKYQWTHQQ